MNEDVQAKVEDFFKAYRLRRYAKGQVLILGGEDTGQIYQLIEGQVKAYDVTYRGDEVILNIFRPPAFFPMSVAMNKQAQPYVYEAETDVALRQAPADEVVEFLKDNPDVMFDLLSRLYRGMDGLLGRMSQLMSGSAKSRLMYELLITARRFGKTQSSGECELELNEKDLGARAGLSRETVNREIHKLKHEGLIEVDGKIIRILDMPMLEKNLAKEI